MKRFSKPVKDTGKENLNLHAEERKGGVLPAKKGTLVRQI